METTSLALEHLLCVIGDRCLRHRGAARAPADARTRSRGRWRTLAAGFGRSTPGFWPILESWIERRYADTARRVDGVALDLSEAGDSRIQLAVFRSIRDQALQPASPDPSQQRTLPQP
jgi:hypothetical protein